MVVLLYGCIAVWLPHFIYKRVNPNGFISLKRFQELPVCTIKFVLHNK
jgi:hypothetical protein